MKRWRALCEVAVRPLGLDCSCSHTPDFSEQSLVMSLVVNLRDLISMTGATLVFLSLFSGVDGFCWFVDSCDALVPRVAMAISRQTLCYLLLVFLLLIYSSIPFRDMRFPSIYGPFHPPLPTFSPRLIGPSTPFPTRCFKRVTHPASQQRVAPAATHLARSPASPPSFLPGGLSESRF